MATNRSPRTSSPPAPSTGPWAFLAQRWELATLAVLAIAPLVIPALGGALGGQVTNLFIYCILALALNVMVGYTGLVHLGIASFFGIGAYVLAILTVPMYPFQIGFLAAAVIGGPENVRDGFMQLAEATDADEFMLVSDVFDADMRLRALDIAAAVMSGGAERIAA